MDPDRPSHTHAKCARLIDRLLPEPAALLSILSADGEWPEHAPEDTVRELTPEQRAVEVLGRALWDIFSNNHTVLDADGVAYDLGSFRGSAGFIAESINRRYEIIPHSYDYMDFYMGNPDNDRATLLAVYRWIFSELRNEGCRWIYSFPRHYIMDFAQPDADPPFTEYDPGESLQRERERNEGEAETEELRRLLDESQAAALERASGAALPAAVAAYREVFGELPEGWPHR